MTSRISKASKISKKIKFALDPRFDVNNTNTNANTNSTSTSNTTVKTEILAGFTTFLTMSYIIFVNPAILATPQTGMNFNGVLTATVLLCFTMTLFMGLYAKLPFGVAPGMGINAFFTYTLVIGDNIPWPTALGMVFWSGVFFLIISLTPLREKLAASLPHNLKVGCAVGIGIFLSFIGLKNAGLIIADPETLVRMGKLTTHNMLTILGLLLIIPLMKKKSPMAFLVGIAAITAISILLGDIAPPQNYFSAPDFTSVFFKLDIWGAMKLALVPAIVSMIFTDLFDSISTFVGVSKATGLTDKNENPLRMKQGLIVDATATLTAGLFGTSAGTAYIESAAGIEAGGRTGLSAVATAIFFLPCLFIAPLVGMVPAVATAPVLIAVGLLMFKNIFDLDMKEIEDWAPAVLTIILIPLTFSITKGLMWGLFIQMVLYVLLGQTKKINLATCLLGAVSAYYLMTN